MSINRLEVGGIFVLQEVEGADEGREGVCVRVCVTSWLWSL